MANPFIGEIRMFGGYFAPAGWAFCDGQLLAIAGNEALFNLIGTQYGGDGQTTFGLPDLRGRAPMHSPGLIGAAWGSEGIALTVAQIPPHAHGMQGSADPASDRNPRGALPAITEKPAYHDATGGTGLAAGSTIALSAGGLPHDNMQPFLCVSFIISLFGIFPSRA
ncbi:MAG TPA: phage tail protein [Verrucomicrobiales bacterium]|nr:phage tail protein [Verrucomicrobiales bacterium]